MASLAADRDLKAAAAERPVHQCIGAGAIHDQGVSNGIFPLRIGKDVPHAAQIAFTLLADIGDKDNRQRMGQAAGMHGGGRRQQRGEAGAVVGNPRSQ